MMLSRISVRACALLPVVATTLVISSCRQVGYDYQASAAIADINIEVGLSQSHPFLAEYQRTVRVENSAPIAFGNDSGGKAYVNVFETSNKLILQTFHTHVIVVDKATKTASTEKRPLSQAEIDSFVGTFEFTELDTYQFVEGDANATFNPSVVKGG